ncbi:MAG: AmmeMemoRadiSam system protein B [Planctomycetota bacterium]
MSRGSGFAAACSLCLALRFLSPVVNAAEDIRPPAVAGAFYPADTRELGDMVRSFLDRAQPTELDGKLVGLVAPHAGYVYSGPVAAWAYREIEGQRYDTVVIIGCSHYARFPGASVGAYAAYRTPLGEVPVDADLARRLIASSRLLRFVPEAHRPEHSLEVQLPFLQTALKNFKILPIVIGDGAFATCSEVAAKIVECTADRKTLLIASTDLSHYFPYDKAKELDGKTVDAILTCDGAKLHQGALNDEYQLCGAAAVVTTMLALSQGGPLHARLLKYANSGDTAGDKSRVVGYAAIALLEAGATSQPASDASAWKPLDEEAGRALFTLARDAIKRYLATGEIPRANPDDYPALREKRGVFVTLYKGETLRGCIGCHSSDDCLCRTVQKMAVAAACGDPRFPPLAAGELRQVRMEISVYLSPLIPIESPALYEPGKHGIVMQRGERSATFLPHVPIEQHWTREETLAALSRKAGLSADAWRAGDARFFVYTTQVLQEK